MEKWKDDWSKDEEAYFEYHCTPSHDSAHAELWYRSQEPVEVLGIASDDAHNREPKLPDDAGIEERMQACRPRVYTVKFEDGYIGKAFEDELLTDSKYFKEKWEPGERRE